MKARDNPFRSECVDALAYRAPEFDWQRLEERLAAAGGRGAIVGPEGHGKTTLLLDWMARRRAAGDAVHFIKLAGKQRRIAAGQRELVQSRGWVFVDSAEQLGWLGWRELLRLTARASRLVVTTHRPGRLPTVFTCRTSPQLLDELVRELTGGDTDCAGSWHRHGGNVRLSLREFYDRSAAKGARASCERGQNVHTSLPKTETP